MIDFKTKISSIVEVEEKMLSLNLKRIAINEARKQTEQAKTFNSLSTSESTSSSDTARLEDDKCYEACRHSIESSQ